MNSYRELPQGYRQIMTIDLQKNKKLALLVNGLALVIAAGAANLQYYDCRWQSYRH